MVHKLNSIITHENIKIGGQPHTKKGINRKKSQNVFFITKGNKTMLSGYIQNIYIWTD